MDSHIKAKTFSKTSNQYTELLLARTAHTKSLLRKTRTIGRAVKQLSSIMETMREVRHIRRTDISLRLAEVQPANFSRLIPPMLTPISKLERPSLRHQQQTVKNRPFEIPLEEHEDKENNGYLLNRL
jgi:hypothetical protein